MKREIFDLLDHYQEDSILLTDTTPLSSARIEELTMKRFKQNHKTGRTRRLTRGLLVAAIIASLCCLTASVVVSYIGLINFIGLVAPHIVRMVVGNNHVYLLPGSILAGSTLLLLGDLFARVAISPVILPIGAITSFLGGPLFLYLLFKGGRSHAER